MYFKVAIIALLSLFLSGCSLFGTPKPKKPNKPEVKVVEKVDNNITDKKQTVAMLDTAPSVAKKYKLKPEPFSLESKEQDPELLGPQTTLSRDLVTANSEKETVKLEDNKKSKNEKDSFNRATVKNSIKKDEKEINKKESL